MLAAIPAGSYFISDTSDKESASEKKKRIKLFFLFLDSPIIFSNYESENYISDEENVPKSKVTTIFSHFLCHFLTSCNSTAVIKDECYLYLAIYGKDS